jgi:enoyl-CoA hydratase/carnithine racemase
LGNGVSSPGTEFGAAAYQSLMCEVDARGVGWLRLRRPPANALDLATIEELTLAVRAARFDPRVKLVALASATPRYFSAGLDLAEVETFDANHLGLIDHLFKDLLVRSMRTARKLFVAVIEGHCLGGGLELALAADLRLGVDGPWQMGLPELKLGGLPGGGGIQMLARLIGPSRALKLVLSGDSMTPGAALDLGVIDVLLSGDGATQGIDEYLGRLAAGPLEAQVAAKLAVREGLELPFDDALLLERELYRGLYGSSDLAEGVRSFREKRAPRFGSQDSTIA